MKKISIDIDNCIADTFKAGMDVCMSSQSINKSGATIPEGYKFRTDKMNHLLGVDPGTANDLWPALFDSEYQIKMIENAADAIGGLMRAGCEITLTTARPMSVNYQTVKWLNDNEVPYSHLSHRPGGHKYDYNDPDKSFDVYIEDNISEYDCILSSKRFISGDRAVLILFDYEWSKTLNVAGNFTIVSGWNDIIKEMSSLLCK